MSCLGRPVCAGADAVRACALLCLTGLRLAGVRGMAVANAFLAGRGLPVRFRPISRAPTTPTAEGLSRARARRERACALADTLAPTAILAKRTITDPAMSPATRNSTAQTTAGLNAPRSESCPTLHSARQLRNDHSYVVSRHHVSRRLVCKAQLGALLAAF